MFTTKKRIAGSDGTYNYVVICQTTLGLVAVRQLDKTSYRIRVEPSNPEASAILAKVLTENIFVDPSWKQPSERSTYGQNRFSTVVNSEGELHAAVMQAVYALRCNGDIILKPDTSNWEAALTAVAAVGTTDRAELIARLRDSDTPGVNSASRWTTSTLVEKVFSLTPND
jgi:hypothetical protein